MEGRASEGNKWKEREGKETDGRAPGKLNGQVDTNGRFFFFSVPLSPTLRRLVKEKSEREEEKERRKGVSHLCVMKFLSPC